jgi:hypothetical protein
MRGKNWNSNEGFVFVKGSFDMIDMQMRIKIQIVFRRYVFIKDSFGMMYMQMRIKIRTVIKRYVFIKGSINNLFK